ncbi:acetyl CoA synthetase subunit alpha, partial [Desulfobacteraceae bacterium SEEP-SAG9]
LLSAYGIPVNKTEIAVTVEEAVEKSEKLGFPVVMKIYSREITHKSDIGGVKLDLKSQAQVEKAFREIMGNMTAANLTGKVEGVTVQPMIKNL